MIIAEEKAVDKRIKANGDYWKKRFEVLEDNQYQNSAAYYKDLQEQFQYADNRIQTDINKWYQRLADNNGVSYAEAKKFLNQSELKEFKWTVEQYIKAGEENAVDQRWMKELENASSKYHISYLEAMKLQIQQYVEPLFIQYAAGTSDFLHQSYAYNYAHTAFEVARGTGIGVNLSTLDTRKIDTIIRKPWAQDGNNFSDRIWSNKQKLINNLHMELSQNILRGSSPRQAINNLSKTMEVSRRQAGTLIMTESAAISAVARKDCFNELGVERYEILATLDSLTSTLCREMDGKVFDMKDYQPGLTANPFHPNCRSTTIPYFDDEFSVLDKRAARDPVTGKTVQVDGTIKYPEWEKRFVIGEGEEQKSKLVKETIIDEKYINSLEYKRRFDNLTDIPEVNKSIYEHSKDMLKHRNGTMYEDMYFIDKNTGKVIASSTKMDIKSAVGYNKEIKKVLSSHNMNDIIAIHNHPSSMPPSAGDFNAALKNRYHEGYIIGHNGTIIRYKPGEELIDKNTYEYRLALERKNVYNEYDAQVSNLDEMKKRYGIEYEVISGGRKG